MLPPALVESFFRGAITAIKDEVSSACPCQSQKGAFRSCVRPSTFVFFLGPFRQTEAFSSCLFTLAIGGAFPNLLRWGSALACDLSSWFGTVDEIWLGRYRCFPSPWYRRAVVLSSIGIWLRAESSALSTESSAFFLF